MYTHKFLFQTIKLCGTWPPKINLSPLHKERLYKKSIKTKIMIYEKIDIPSSYAKIRGAGEFQPQEFPRSGSKAKDVKEERTRERRRA